MRCTISSVGRSPRDDEAEDQWRYTRTVTRAEDGCIGSERWQRLSGCSEQALPRLPG